MAYAPVISLRHTMERLAYSSQEIVTSLYKEVMSLQQILKRASSSSSIMNAIDAQIREAVSKFEDVFESYVSDQVASQSQVFGDEVKLSVDLQNLEHEIDFFVKALKKMEEEDTKELDSPDEEVEEDDSASSVVDFDGENSKIIGLSDVYNELRDQLTVIEQLLRFKVVALVGMAGIGKTTLARKFFEDTLIFYYFECKAWVKVGRKFQLKKILWRILAQVDSSFDKDGMFREGEEKLAQYLRESLKSKRFLIVLDDIWNTSLLVDIAKLCHYDKDGSRILLTSRLQNLGGRGPKVLHMRLLSKDESWDLLREKVFGEELCSYQLEKVGRKLAEHCEGLPLTIIKVAHFISKYGERTVEYWSEVMLRKNHQVYIDAYKEISDVVFPSYDNLQQHLKACFLYLGVFRQGYEIRQSNLINMWIAEGFLEPYNIQVLVNYSKACLHELISNSLVMFNQQSSITFLEQAKGIKTCKLHSFVWYLYNREAGNNKFFRVLTYRADGLTDAMESQRRLCIHNSILLGIKDVRESLVENCESSVRSLLCFGIYHQYQVPVCSDFKLLRLLDALTIRMYDFPNEVLDLIHLRYLALTCDGEVPASISKLWNLHILIVNRHLSIKASEKPSYLSMEIWDMKGLKHLQVMGCDLRHPNGDFLCHLETLLDVSFDSYQEGILEAIPNLKKLGVQILALDNAGYSNSSYFNRISHLHKLQTLKCVVVNPEFESAFVQSSLPDLSMLPSSLTKLSLSGFAYPWECMGAIASLPNLQVLKLRCYAFQGPKWEVEENGFLKLQFLIIEDSDLKEWKVGHGSFPWLCKLSLKDCYNLEEIQWKFDSGVFRSIEIVDCNPLGVICLE